MNTKDHTQSASLSELLLRAAELKHAGDRPGALALYRKALRRFGATPELLAALGLQRYLIAMSDPKWDGAGYTEAIAALGAAIELAPRSAHLHSILAEIYQLGLLDYATALREYRRAIELNPCDAGSMAAIAFMYGPPELDGILTLEEAINYGERAARLEPKRFGYHHSLGHLYRQAGNRAAAEREWMTALLCPEPLEQRLIDSVRTSLEELRGRAPLNAGTSTSR